jgi:HEAT repeat protein
MNLLHAGYASGYVGVAMGCIGQDAIAPLIEALTNDTVSVRVEVVRALGSMPMYSRQKDIQMSGAIATLVNSLGDKSPYVRCLAVNSLGELHREDQMVVPALIKSLDDSDVQTRWNACLALGKFGKQAAPALRRLLAALHDSSADVRGCAAIALAQIEPGNADQITSLLPILIENIQGIGGTNLNFRYPTATVLGSCGELAKPAVPALIKAAKATAGYERNEILTALNKIDPQAAATAGLK